MQYLKNSYSITLKSFINNSIPLIIKINFRPIKLVVAKCWDPNPKGYFTIPRTEPVRPIDPGNYQLFLFMKLFLLLFIKLFLFINVHNDFEFFVLNGSYLLPSVTYVYFIGHNTNLNYYYYYIL